MTCYKTPKLSIAQYKMTQACNLRKLILLINQILFSTLLLQSNGTLKHYKTEDNILVKEKKKGCLHHVWHIWIFKIASKFRKHSNKTLIPLTSNVGHQKFFRQVGAVCTKRWHHVIIAWSSNIAHRFLRAPSPTSK